MWICDVWICDTCKLLRYDSPVGLATPQCMCMWRQNTAPPKREWQELTDEEIAEGAKQSWVDKQAFESAVWWAEAKLKEKNT